MWFQFIFDKPQVHWFLLLDLFSQIVHFSHNWNYNVPTMKKWFYQLASLSKIFGRGPNPWFGEINWNLDTRCEGKDFLKCHKKCFCFPSAKAPIISAGIRKRLLIRKFHKKFVLSPTWQLRSFYPPPPHLWCWELRVPKKNYVADVLQVPVLI